MCAIISHHFLLPFSASDGIFVD
jgi:hypothetical protein